MIALRGSLILAFAGVASLRANLITMKPDGGLTTVFQGGKTCSGGPTAAMDAGFLVTSTGPACFPYSNGWGFGSQFGNGTWDAGFSLVGTNTSDIIKIDLGAMTSSVGGFLNYVIFNQSLFAPKPFFPFIAALGADGGILESYDLFTDAPISTPNGIDAGAYRGISRASADIRYFEIGFDGIALHEITVDPAPASEPAAVMMVSVGGVAILLVRRKRQSVDKAGDLIPSVAAAGDVSALS